MPTNIEREDKLQKKFEDKLPEDWRTRIQAMDTETLKATVIEVSTNENDNQTHREEDEELAAKKEAYADTLAPYKDASTVNKLKLKFLLRELERNGAV